MKRSKFSLSNYKLLTCDMGLLVPCGLMEVLPGDTVQQATSALIRVSPLLAPVMHPVQVRIHHWFVPHRLVWDGWEDFITGGPDGMDTGPVPQLSPGLGVGTLSDYLGIPPAANGNVSALPFRGYQLIFNEWYRDQDLVQESPISKASGLDAITSTAIQRISWEKDYFTSSRPWTQKGPEITVPLGGTAPILGTGTPTFRIGGAQVEGLSSITGDRALQFQNQANATGAVDWADPKLTADLSSATSANINDLRRAFALQRYEEARARYGSRYTEYLRYLGVKSSDARLQRPEYLGGGKQTIQFSEVLQTGPSAEDAGVADLKGHGIGAMRSNRYRRFFEEHGFVFSLMSVRPKTMYVQGVPRHWSRQTKEDYFQKELQHIGQQEVYAREIYGPGTNPGAVFGYQDRYDEYRRTESSIAGEFRTTLDFWHYGRIFATEPTLNSSFVNCEPTKRVNAEQTQHCLWVMTNHNIQARRMVAKVGTSNIF